MSTPTSYLPRCPDCQAHPGWAHPDESGRREPADVCRACFGSGVEQTAKPARRCEDFPCCGHTTEDPCDPQWFDAPGAFDTSRPGNEHALCDHESGDCHVDEPYDEDDE